MTRFVTPIPPTVGVDTGVGTTRSSGTGIAAVSGTDVLAAATLRPDGPVTDPDEAIAFFKAITAVVDDWTARFPGPWTVAVEYIVDPDGRSTRRKATSRTTTKTRGVPGAPVIAAWIGGMVCAHYGATAVYPDGNGRHPLATYPDVLAGERPAEWRQWSLSGDRDHERAAADIAYAAHGIDR